MKKSINNNKNNISVQQAERIKNSIQTAALHNLGCKVNFYETQRMAKALEDAGIRIVDFEDTADIYVINTCSVTQIADKKSRQMIRRARRKNPDAIVVAAGCFVQAAELEPKDVGADIFLGNDKKGELVEVIKEYQKNKDRLTEVIDINDPSEDYEELYVGGSEENTIAAESEQKREDEAAGQPGNEERMVERTALSHTRAFVKVQDGCNQFCTYCRIPYVRGRTRSRGMSSVIEEVGELIEKGCQEIVLTGIHISSYDDNGRDLMDLIEKIDQIPGMSRLRLGSLEPRFITEKSAKRMAACPSICPHFHLSLQSGCDATIHRMNRKYTTEDFRKGVGLLRKYFDDPAITTDVIVGFPGETAEEFAITKQFVEEIAFSDMHVFKFSAREGTRAFSMPDQVAEEIKNERSDELLALTEEMSKAYRRRWNGRKAQVLFEERVEHEGRQQWTGFTREYLRVYAEDEADLANEIRVVVL